MSRYLHYAPLVEVTLRTFALEKIDLRRGNLPEYTRGKFISGFIFPRWKGHTDENHIYLGIYKGLTGLNFMPFKHIFGAQIENNMLENHSDQRAMVLLFSLFFFYVAATSKAITSDFSSAPDCSISPKKNDKLRCFSVYLPLLLCGFFQSLRTGLKTCSFQMLWTCDVVEKTFGLQGKHSLILFARLLLLLFSSFDTRTFKTCCSLDMFKLQWGNLPGEKLVIILILSFPR